MTLVQIEKQFGKGSVLWLGSKEAIVPVATISSAADLVSAASYTLTRPGATKTRLSRLRLTEPLAPESLSAATSAESVPDSRRMYSE